VRWILMTGGAAGLAMMLASPWVRRRVPWLRLLLAAFRRWGGAFSRLAARISPGLDLRILVGLANRHFRRAYRHTPFAQRALFLPFCLRPADCPAEVSQDHGLLCSGNCPGCRLGGLTGRARELGYAAVYVVPSSRLLPGRGLKPSDSFIMHKLKEHGPAAALGVVCGWHLRNRLLPRYQVGRRGVDLGGGRAAALQGMLLKAKRCRGASVDWARLERLVRLGPPARQPH